MRIALVEPSRTNQRIVAGLIEPWGHEVYSFADAPEALAFLHVEPDVRVLISSIELDSMSGIQLVRNVRASLEPQRPLYIIVMSSSHERSKMIEALDGGADDYISKPPMTEELHARLRAADRITSMQAELVVLAKTDPLTGLLNRRAFVEAAQRLLERAATGHPLSALICDLDKFKSINDTYGHEVGDLVLRKVSAEARALGVPAGRLGGEEFAFLVEAASDGAIELAERFRAAVAELAIPAAGGEIKVTISIGLAEWKPADTLDSLLRKADIALYEAKRSGRNRTIAADTFPLAKEHEQWRGIARMTARSA